MNYPLESLLEKTERERQIEEEKKRKKAREEQKKAEQKRKEQERLQKEREEAERAHEEMLRNNSASPTSSTNCKLIVQVDYNYRIID